MRIPFRLPPEAGKLYRVVLPVMGLLIALWGFFVKAPDMPPGFEKFRKLPMALEFAKDQTEVNTLAKDHRSILRDGLSGDSKYVIPSYWLYFAFLGGFLYVRKTPLGALWLLALPVLISAAAIADLFENAFSAAALERQSLADLIHIAAEAKWFIFGVSCVLLGLGFLLRKRTWPAVAGSGYVLSGSLILVGLILFYPLLIEAGFGVLGLAVACTGKAIQHAGSS